ncbi:hypothetical protein I9W82_004827 [Candida metapsilosis]|uniref:Uncharacterized protein n=1 Tax=Candida metapsilosis TaxID=273372 RepID=A0A8H7ZBH0_9ASCO|nr:hypothetical protein I9W82_004827 [Candida metapsilosis]
MTDIDRKMHNFDNGSRETTATSPRLDSNLGSVFDTPAKEQQQPTSSTLGTSPELAHPTGQNTKAQDAQTRLKQELIEEKRKLLQTKAEKLNRIEALQTRLQQLMKSQEERTDRAKLDQLLERSEVEFYKNLQARNQQQSNYISQHLNVLPSPNWDSRLSSAKRFIPFLDIDKLKTHNEYIDDRLVRVFQFTILSPLVLNLTLKLEINALNDSVYQILVMTNLKTLQMLSSSFTRALLSDYIPNGKINCVMYGLNSLTKLIQKRMKTWHQLITTYRSMVDNERLRDIPDKVSDYKQLYANLKSVEYIDLTVESKYKLRLHWSIVNNDHLTGSCQSDIQLYITFNGNAVLKNAGSLFTSLIPKYGVINSLEIFLGNIFKL